MGRAWRSLASVVLALVGVVILGVSTSMSTIASLLAINALVMGGNTTPDPSDEYVDGQINNYYDATLPAANRFPVHTPEEFWPLNGTLTFDQSTAQGVTDLEAAMAEHDGSMVIVGYSASTRLASAEKRKLIEEGDSRDISFVLISDVNKGNGGILARFPGWTIPVLGVTFDGAAPTDSGGQFETKSITIVHDGWSDFPIYPVNALALGNAVAGIALLHGTYPNLQNPDLTEVGTTGDTTYYVIGTDIVPILLPLEMVGVPRPILLAVDEPMRVLIEAGYRRDIDPGAPTPAYLIPIVNPVSLATNFVVAIPVGIDDGLEASNLGRPLGTQPSGPFGVGGDDEDLEGLPPGFIPLGNPVAPTGSTTTTSTLAAPPDDTSRVAQDPEPVVDEPETVADEPDPGTVERDTAVEDEKPTADRPKSLRPILRGPITFDAPKLPSQRKTADRPLKRIVDSLTGLLPKPVKDSAGSSSTPGDDSSDAA